MEEKSREYKVDLTELEKENMHFTVENQRPLTTDGNLKKAIEKELFLIFEKYKSTRDT